MFTHLEGQGKGLFKETVCCQDYIPSEVEQCGKVMEHWYDEPDSDVPQYSERSVKQCYFV